MVTYGQAKHRERDGDGDPLLLVLTCWESLFMSKKLWTALVPILTNTFEYF